MSPLLFLLFFLVDIPAFLYFKKKYFPTSEALHQALQFDHPPELSHHILNQEWQQIALHLRLPAFTASCAALLTLQFGFVQLVQGL